MALIEKEPILHTPQAPVEQMPVFAELADQFKFDMRGHQMVDPTDTDGHVASVTEVDPISMAGEALPEGVRVFDVVVADPFTTADPEGFQIVDDYIADMEASVRSHGFDPLEERQKKHPYQGQKNSQQGYKFRNFFTAAWLDGENMRAVRAWHSKVPHARALSTLINPVMGEEIVDSKGNAFTSTAESTINFRFVRDAVAIRNRSVAMRQIAETHLAETAQTTDERLQWLSLASGTAEPSIAAVKAVDEAQGTDIKLTVVDYDTDALAHVQESAERFDYKGDLTVLEQDILSPTVAQELAEQTGQTTGYDIVEILGFEEYLPEEGDEIGAFRAMPGLPQASTFTRNAYDLVKPGGALISGNMVVDRPQSDFVFGIVNWPIINARSEESIMRVYKNAGIIDDPCSEVQLFRVIDQQTGTHIYDIVKVEKLVDPRLDGMTLPFGILPQIDPVQ